MSDIATGVARHNAGHRIHTVFAQEELANAAIRITANGRPEMQPEGFNRKSLCRSPVW